MSDDPFADAMSDIPHPEEDREDEEPEDDGE